MTSYIDLSTSQWVITLHMVEIKDKYLAHVISLHVLICFHIHSPLCDSYHRGIPMGDYPIRLITHTGDHLHHVAIVALLIFAMLLYNLFGLFIFHDMDIKIIIIFGLLDSLGDELPICHEIWMFNNTSRKYNGSHVADMVPFVKKFGIVVDELAFDELHQVNLFLKISFPFFHFVFDYAKWEMCVFCLCINV